MSSFWECFGACVSSYCVTALFVYLYLIQAKLFSLLYTVYAMHYIYVTFKSEINIIFCMINELMYKYISPKICNRYLAYN